MGARPHARQAAPSASAKCPARTVGGEQPGGRHLTSADRWRRIRGMSRPVSQGHASRRHSAAQGELVWLGGCFQLPGYVTEAEPYRPDLVLWLELPSGLVVGGHVAPREAVWPLATALRMALERPARGAARKPPRLRVTLENGIGPRSSADGHPGARRRGTRAYPSSALSMKASASSSFRLSSDTSASARQPNARQRGSRWTSAVACCRSTSGELLIFRPGCAGRLSNREERPMPSGPPGRARRRVPCRRACRPCRGVAQRPPDRE